MSNPWVSFLRIDIAYWGWPLIWARNTDASQRGRALRILTICGSSNPAERSLPSTEVPGSDLAKDLQEYVEVRNTVDPSIYAYLCLSMPMLSQTCGTGSAEGVRRVPSSTTNPMRALVAGLFFVAFQHINLNLMQFFQFTHQKKHAMRLFHGTFLPTSPRWAFRCVHCINLRLCHTRHPGWAQGHGPHLSM